MCKWTEENVLYFSSKKKFKVSKDAASQSGLRKLISSMKKSKLIEFSHDEKFSNYYSITPKGKERLSKYQEDFKSANSKLPLENKNTKNDDGSKHKKGFHVYFGYDKKSGKLVYIGTTIQKPADRWRWHKHNGKDLNFELHKTCESADEMLTMEFELINKHKPKLNNITHRKQNLNVKLTKEQLGKRVGDKEWCQCCLKRRAKNGNKCSYC